jgi:polar amino acid transport system substrate-binding protein
MIPAPPQSDASKPPHARASVSHGLRFAFLNEPPFCYRGRDGRVTGCDVEVARRIVEQVGAGPFIPVETEFAQLLPGLADGRWQMTTGLCATEARREIAAFSRPIWALSDGLLVRADNPHGIEGYSSLARTPGPNLGVVKEQVQHRTAIRLGIPAQSILTFDAYEEAAVALAAGAIDAFASVEMAHRGYLQEHSVLGLSIIGVPDREKPAEPGAFAFARVQSWLQDAIDDALAAFLGSADHRALMARFGFTAEDVDRIATC